MTRASIEAIPAGRECDLAVARLIEPMPVGPTTVHIHPLASDAGAWRYGYDYQRNGQRWEAMPFSTNIATAMEALEKLHKRFTIHREPIDDAEYHVIIQHSVHGHMVGDGADDTLPLAICRALLLAAEAGS